EGSKAPSLSTRPSRIWRGHRKFGVIGSSAPIPSRSPILLIQIGRSASVIFSVLPSPLNGRIPRQLNDRQDFQFVWRQIPCLGLRDDATTTPYSILAPVPAKKLDAFDLLLGRFGQRYRGELVGTVRG